GLRGGEVLARGRLGGERRGERLELGELARQLPEPGRIADHVGFGQQALELFPALGEHLEFLSQVRVHASGSGSAPNRRPAARSSSRSPLAAASRRATVGVWSTRLVRVWAR